MTDQFQFLIGFACGAVLLAAFATAISERYRRKEIDALTHDVDRLLDIANGQEDEIERLEAALETIAEEHDAGRHDGLPEPCPAHDDVTMWMTAREALEVKGKD